jgi:hypothetical protein
MCTPIVAMQWLGEKITVAMNTHATTEELLDALFYMQSVLYQESTVCD